MNKKSKSKSSCQAFIKFYRDSDNKYKLTGFKETHDHEINVEKGDKNTKKSDWTSLADKVIIEGVLDDKSVEEIRAAMKKERISPLPSMQTVHKRIQVMRENIFGKDPRI